MMFREPLDLPDEYDVDDVEPWSWSAALVVQFGAAAFLWLLIFFGLLYAGVFSW
jgi:hypothetical protein